MKSHHYLTIFSFVAFLGLGWMVKINQAPKQRTSAPGESACGGCHSGNFNTGPASVTLSLPTAYIPGQTYTLTFGVVDTVTFPNPRFGFSTTALDGSNNPAGTFIVTNSNNTSLQTGTVQGALRSYLGHVNANSTDSWTFDWTAPASNVGPVTFYAGNVVANANSSTSGDYAYSNTFVLDFLATFPQPDFTLSANQICGSDSVVIADKSQE